MSVRSVREERCEVVVVGTGAGGAVAACELAEAGWDVIMVEEGGHYTTADFTIDPRHMIPALYRDAGTAMIRGKPNIYFSEGMCVGGSTAINGGMCWRTPERILRRWQHLGIAAIDADAMAPYFERVERRINVGPQDPESIGRDNELLVKGCDKLGLTLTPNRRNQIHCAGANSCILGCPTGSKQSTLVTYVPRAQRAGARLLTRVRADRVLWDGARAAGIEGHTTELHEQPATRVLVRADAVIAAGGAAQTPALLGRSGVRHRQLGKNLLCHPNVKVVGVFDEDVRSYQGVHQSHQCHDYFDDGIIFALAGVPPGVVSMSFPQYGRASADIMQEYNRMVFTGALIEDTGSGHVSLTRSGDPVMHYRINRKDRRTAVWGAGMLAQVLLAAGAKRVYLPFFGVPPITTMNQAIAIGSSDVPAQHIELLTVHIMGTARMGPDPKRDVCDNYGEVHGHPGLFVADASAFPGAVGVNPMETIMGLATRFALRLADRREVFVRARAS